MAGTVSTDMMAWTMELSTAILASPLQPPAVHVRHLTAEDQLENRAFSPTRRGGSHPCHRYGSPALTSAAGRPALSTNPVTECRRWAAQLMMWGYLDVAPQVSPDNRAPASTAVDFSAPSWNSSQTEPTHWVGYTTPTVVPTTTTASPWRGARA